MVGCEEEIPPKKKQLKTKKEKKWLAEKGMKDRDNLYKGKFD